MSVHTVAISLQTMNTPSKWSMSTRYEELLFRFVCITYVKELIISNPLLILLLFVVLKNTQITHGHERFNPCLLSAIISLRLLTT